MTNCVRRDLYSFFSSLYEIEERQYNMTDSEYLKRIINNFLSIDTRDKRRSELDDAILQLRQKMYYPIELSLPFDNLDVLLGKYDEEEKKIDNKFRIVRTGDDADDKALTKDDSGFFASCPLRKMIFAPPGCSKTLFTKKLAFYLADTQDLNLFPLYLQCDRLNESEDNDEDFVRLAYKMQVIEIDEESFKKIIKEHTDNGVLIIDGLDECSEDDRKVFAKSLNTFLNEHNDVGFVITSRLRQYSKQELADPENTKYHFIKKLNDSAIFSYCIKWILLYRSIIGEAIGDAEAEAEAKEIIDYFNKNSDDSIRSLVRIPMHCSNMLKMREENYEGLPRNIKQYYEDYIKLKMRRISGNDEFYDKLIQYMAYWMSCCPHKRYVSIEESTLTEEVIGSYIKQLDVKNRKVEDVLDTLVNNMSVLTQVSLDHSDEYRFEHLSLQELLTAKAIKSKITTDFDGYIRKDENSVDFIRRITYDDGWKEFDQIIRYVLQQASGNAKKDIEYLLKKKGIYDSVKSLT